ncbi:MAG: type II toxin-antitoxin system RelE/ParE family toxin [Pseudomonadota bacterium]
MIKTFEHKGLRKFWESGSTAGIKHSHAVKLRLILQRLDAAEEIGDIDFSEAKLHQLKGNMKGLWSVNVNGNWRITFKFEKGDVYIVNYLDYH